MDVSRFVAVTAGCVLAVLSAASADTNAGLTRFRAGEFAEAQVEWRSAAAAGDPVAALYLGVSYDTGEGVTQDSRTAADWYRQAAEGGSASAAFNLAVLHDNGSDTMRDPAEALRWYLRAAELGSARAEYNLGLLYQGGTSVPADQGRAARFFQLAAQHGIAAARPHLLELGRPVGKPVAARPSEDRTMSDFRQAQLALLTRGAVESSRAVALFRRAAEKNDALAAYDLAYCYENGLGVPLDRVAAYQWYQRASANAADSRVRQLASNGASALRSKLNPDERRQASIDNNAP